MRWFIGVLGVLAAVASHRCIDILVGSGLARDTGREYAHVVVSPTVLGSIAMIVGLLGFAIADRGTWFADLVREVEEIRATRIFVAIVLLGALTLFAMESLEQIVATGHLLGSLTWLGTSPSLALLVILSVSAAMSFCIVRCAHSLLAVIGAVRSLAYGFAIALRARTHAGTRSTTFAFSAHARTTASVRAVSALRRKRPSARLQHERVALLLRRVLKGGEGG
jgi:hypothetical protein